MDGDARMDENSLTGQCSSIGGDVFQAGEDIVNMVRLKFPRMHADVAVLALHVAITRLGCLSIDAENEKVDQFNEAMNRIKSG
jgi:hypothetical protein